ncbi:MAG: enoyl-CoA hydratase/isomerase family protein [Blastocatellia bacterium]|nr:enoyl-CoA hydratase/isomerase family protein [Blastocatellia bacterium]
MDDVIASTKDRIRYVTLSRPEKRNALNGELVAGLKAALREADSDEELRAVVIRGAGQDFCSGADLAELQKIASNSFEENIADAGELAELFLLTRQVRVPVIAAVHGRALAGGCGLATACDLVVATKSARFGYPEVKIGFVPAMVAAILRRNLGEKKSFELLTQGFEYSAVEAAELGLVNRVVEDDELEASVAEYVSIYAKVSGSAVAMTKRLIYEIDGETFEEAVEKGVQTNARARMTKDCKTGVARFFNRE